MTYQIISREQWGARHEDGFGWRALPIPEKWLHHSVTIAPDLLWVDVDGDGVEDDEERAMRILEDIGEDRFGRGISYTFCVMPSGRIYEGHSIDRVGAHTANRNSISAGICLVGNYDGTGPTEMQRNAIAWLLEHGRAEGWWYSNQLTGGHRDTYATGCPGNEGYAAIADINNRAATGSYMEDIVTPEDRKAIADDVEARIRNAIWGNETVEQQLRRAASSNDVVWDQSLFPSPFAEDDGELVSARNILLKTAALVDELKNGAQ